MTRPSNVRLEDTGITHKVTSVRAVTLCGAPLFDRRPPGVETGDNVDCMACLVKDGADDEDPRGIRTAHGIKDLRYRR